MKRIGSLLLVVLLLLCAAPVSAASIADSGSSIVLHADSSWYILDGEWKQASHIFEKDSFGNFFISIDDFRTIFNCHITYSYDDFSIYVLHEGREIWQCLNTPVMFVDKQAYPNPAAYISSVGGAVMIPAEPYASVLGYKGEFSTSPAYAPGQLHFTLPTKIYTISNIEVNKAMQTVTVYGVDGTGATKALRHFVCSTGNPTSLTPNGTFYARPLTYAKAGDPWYYFSAHNCWILYCTQITGDICFHSITFNGRGVNTLSRSAYSNLGNPASHGCIRLTVEDAKFIWENCKGVPVHITDGSYNDNLQGIKTQFANTRPTYSDYVSSLYGKY